MKGNKILYAGIAILILGIGFAVGTYAYYQTTITGTATGTVLAWNCTANDAGQGDQFQVSLGSLYPGSTGSRSITITSSISAKYSITFSAFTNMGESSNHSKLNLYTDSAHASIINAGQTPNVYKDKTIAAGGTATETFYYYWPYDGLETYNSAAPSVTITVVCTQT